MRDGTNTRKKLERCALTLFVKKGVTATTIKDIANDADIAEGTLYRHYQSKEELAQSLFINAYDEVAHQVQKLAAQQPTFEQKLKAMVKFFCEKYDEDPILFNYLLLVQHTQLKAVTERELNAHALLVSLFNEAMRKKELTTRDPHFCASVVLGIVLQAAISRVYGRIKRSMMADVDDLVRAIEGALKGG